MRMIHSIFFLILLSITGCGPTTTGNPAAPVSLRMEDRQPFAWIKRGWDALIPPAYSAVNNIKFCFKRLRFKPNSTTTGSNFDLELGEVDIDPTGTNLLTVKVPLGTYERIEFDLDKECDSVAGKPSVIFTNGNGTFSTQDHITIKFDGNFKVSSAETITLNIDNLISVLDPINDANLIKDELESDAAVGDFSN